MNSNIPQRPHSRPSAAKRRTELAPPVQAATEPFHWLAIVLVMIIILICTGIGWVIFSQQRLLQQRSQAIAKLAATASALEKQQQDQALALNERNRDWQTSMAELQQAMDSLREAQTQIATVTAERHAAMNEHQQSMHTVHETTQQLMRIAPQLQSDPVLCRETWTVAQQLAQVGEVGDSAAAAALQNLSQAHSVPTNARLEFLGVERVDGALLVDLSVQDAQHRFLTGLSRVDVEVLQSEARLHAVSMIETTRPTAQLHVAVLLDGSSSTSGAANTAIKQAALLFVRRMTQPSRLKVWRFADTVEALSPWTWDGSVHADAINGLTANGGTALYRALRTAAEELQQKSGANAIVVITDGNDSFQGDSPDSALRICQQAQIPIHVLALSDPQTNTRELQRVATSTDGTFQTVQQPELLVERFDSIAQSLLQPVYRIRIESAELMTPLSIRVGGLPPEIVPIRF